jgi:hypothetical protein
MSDTEGERPSDSTPETPIDTPAAPPAEGTTPPAQQPVVPTAPAQPVAPAVPSQAPAWQAPQGMPPAGAPAGYPSYPQQAPQYAPPRGQAYAGQPAAGQQSLHVPDLPPAADKAGQLGGKVPTPGAIDDWHNVLTPSGPGPWRRHPRSVHDPVLGIARTVRPGSPRATASRAPIVMTNT